MSSQASFFSPLNPKVEGGKGTVGIDRWLCACLPCVAHRILIALPARPPSNQLRLNSWIQSH